MEITKDEREKILDLYHRGWKMPREIAQLCELPEDSVRAVVIEDLMARYAVSGALDQPKLKRTPEDVAQMFIEYANGTPVYKLAEKYHMAKDRMRKLLRPASAIHRKTRTPFLSAAATSRVVQDKLVENVLRKLSRDDQREAALDDLRQVVAEKSLSGASETADRLREKVRLDPVPDKELRALADVFKVQVHAGQLLSGKPTERVEQLLDGLDALSDEELRLFLSSDEG